MKTITVRAEDKIVEMLNYFRELDPNGGKSQSDFIISAIKNECERIRSLRKGDMHLKVPNPQFFNTTEDQREKQILNLSNLDSIMKQTCISLNPGIGKICLYYQDRLITDDTYLRDKFQNNFYKDLDFLNSLEGRCELDKLKQKFLEKRD